ncbi:MAG: hypothetical protein MK066_13620, partial [Crocinitomicaceae bacterium]|nr:hypothetical protein [Crocinitomicaceae bacterium]
MKTLVSLIFLNIVYLSFGQLLETDLDENNVNATLNDGGVFFYKSDITGPGYEVPKNSGKNVIFALSPWFGGIDSLGNIRVCAQRYQPNEDQFIGPVTIGTTQLMPAGSWTETLFSVSRDEIQNHLSNYADPNYVAPNGILHWPAHGDVSLGFDYNLAPFVDVNQDGVYDPSEGDYPCIKGDRAVYVIMNDSGVHGSGSLPLGIEIHYMFYQFDMNDAIGNTTFCNMRIINRGTINYADFRVSLYSDIDIGGYSDDYVGTDVQRNMVYTYNSDSFDESVPSISPNTYGSEPPACGILSLNNSILLSRSYTSTASYPYDDPSDFMG